MGHMDVIPFISDGFNIYFPIAILLLCFFSLFNIGKKILHRFGFQLFISNDELTQELIDEGKELVRRGMFAKFTIARILLSILSTIDVVRK